MEEPSAPHELGRGKSLIPESPEQPPCRSAADNAAIPYDLIAILVGILVAYLGRSPICSLISPTRLVILSAM